MKLVSSEVRLENFKPHFQEAAIQVAAFFIFLSCQCIHVFATNSYVGSESCKSCHIESFTAWQGSHHDLAMQPANNDTVLGNFNSAQFNYFGTISTFYKEGNNYFVRTDGPDGKLADYPVKYTFGVYPLQQYLIPFDKGKIQALNIVWDSRPAERRRTTVVSSLSR